MAKASRNHRGAKSSAPRTACRGATQTGAARPVPPTTPGAGNVLPPIRGVRYNLPVRFPDLWAWSGLKPPERPEWSALDPAPPSGSGPYWRPELWEALFATLLREVAQRDPGWAQGFESALRDQVIRPAFLRQEGPAGVSDRLARFRPRGRGRPRGAPNVKGKPGPRADRDVMAGLLTGVDAVLRTKWDSGSGYRLNTAEDLGARWAALREGLDTPMPPFPKAEVRALISRRTQPRRLAACLVAKAFGFAPSTVARHVLPARKSPTAFVIRKVLMAD